MLLIIHPNICNCVQLNDIIHKDTKYYLQWRPDYLNEDNIFFCVVDYSTSSFDATLKTEMLHVYDKSGKDVFHRDFEGNHILQIYPFSIDSSSAQYLIIIWSHGAFSTAISIYGDKKNKVVLLFEEIARDSIEFSNVIKDNNSLELIITTAECGTCQRESYLYVWRNETYVKKGKYNSCDNCTKNKK